MRGRGEARRGGAVLGGVLRSSVGECWCDAGGAQRHAAGRQGRGVGGDTYTAEGV